MAQLIDTIIEGQLEVTEDVIINTDIMFEDEELEGLYTTLVSE